MSSMSSSSANDEVKSEGSASESLHEDDSQVVGDGPSERINSASFATGVLVTAVLGLILSLVFRWFDGTQDIANYWQWCCTAGMVITTCVMTSLTTRTMRVTKELNQLRREFKTRHMEADLGQSLMEAFMEAVRRVKSESKSEAREPESD